MTTCPRCAKPSPIITQKARDCVFKIGPSTRSSAKKLSELRKSVSDSSATTRPLDESLLFHFDNSNSSSDGSGSERKIRRTLFSPVFKQSAGENSCSSSLNSTRLSFDSYLTPSASDLSPEIEEYGSCSGRSCGFKFCVKCLLDHHPGKKCRASMEFFSPTRDDDSTSSRGNLACSRQSRRTLKRLCT